MGIFEFGSRIIIGSIQFLLQQAIVLQLAREKFTWKQLMISTICLRLVSVLTEQFVHYLSSVKMIVWLVAIFLSYLLIYRKSWLKSGIYASGQMMLTTVMEYIFLPILLFFQGVLVYEMQFIFRIFITMVLVAIFLITRKIKLSIPQGINNEKLRYWALYLVFLFLFTFPNITYIEATKKFTFDMMEIYNIILFIFFFGYNFIYVHNIFKITNISQQLETQELYLQTLEESSTQLRAFKHDYDNMLNTVGGLIDSDDMEGLKRFRDELGLDLLGANNTAYINSQLVNIPLLRGIVLTKASAASRNHVEFRVSIPCEIKLRYCSSTDFCRMVGILLDNALEAATLSERRYMELAVMHKRDVYRIIVRNSCPGPVDTEKIFQQGFTTKANHTGLGLHTVNAIVQRYRKEDYAMDIQARYDDDGIFSIILTV